jgi:hypothetical protein
VAEEYCFLGCGAILPGRSLLTFWMNVLSPSTGLKSKPKRQAGYLSLVLFQFYFECNKFRIQFSWKNGW